MPHTTFPSSKVYIALFTVYIVWGSTYLANSIAIEGLPPFVMNGSRLLVAGIILFTISYFTGSPIPTRLHWRNSFLIGVILMGFSSGAMVFSLQYVASGLVAIAGATIPLWAVIFATLWERLPNRREMFGLVLGFAGIVVLNLGNEIWVNPKGGFALLFFPMMWGLGSMWSRHVELPGGTMTSATQLIFGGLSELLISLLSGESVTHFPSTRTLLAMLYLLLFGSMLTFSAYSYVLQHASPIMATSYAYVNPIIAVFLGWLIADEELNGQIFLAGILIIAAVIIITTSRVPAGRITRLIRGERVPAAQ